jgi:ubiquinone/menaquinone biosynthesis C-methylase UbiE
LNRIKDLLKVFKDESTSYDEWYSKPLGAHVLYSELNALEVFLPKEGIGIDLGAGTGIFSEKLSTPDRDVVSLDPSPDMLEKAVKRDMPSIIGLGENLPIRDNCMDFVYMVTVLEFLSKPFKTLESVNLTLKRDAPLVILFINKDSAWGEYYEKLADEGHPIFAHAHFYSLDDMRNLLNQSGYQLENSKGTLTIMPEEHGYDYELVPVNTGTGVIIVKATPET